MAYKRLETVFSLDTTSKSGYIRVSEGGKRQQRYLKGENLCTTGSQESGRKSGKDTWKPGVSSSVDTAGIIEEKIVRGNQNRTDTRISAGKPLGEFTMIAINLATGQEVTFDPRTTPEYAVAYCHYVYDRNMASWFHQTCQDAVEQKRRIPLWQEKSHFIYGNRSVSLGNWAALI